MITLEKAKKAVGAEDEKHLKSFAFAEMQKLLSVIPAAENYKEKDCLFAYEDGLLGVFTLSGKSMETLSKKRSNRQR